MQQETTDKKYFRLYAENNDFCPEVKELTAEEEAAIDPNKFVNPYRYAKYEQAERAMVYHVRRVLGMVRMF